MVGAAIDNRAAGGKIALRRLRWRGHLIANVDEAFAPTVAAGADVITRPTDYFPGAGSGALRDPFGHWWVISTRVQDPSPEDIIHMSESAPGLAQPGPGEIA